MGANGAWLQVRVADRDRVVHALIEELGSRRGARLVGRGLAATRKRDVVAFAVDSSDAEWTTIVADDDRLDFDLAIRLSERLDALVFCSEIIDGARYRAEGLLGPGAAAIGPRMDGDYTLWPDNVLGERGFGDLGEHDEDGFEFLAFTSARSAPSLDWERVFVDSRSDRYCVTFSNEGVESSFGGVIMERAALEERDAGPFAIIESLEARVRQGAVLEESTARLRSRPTTFELALEPCSYSSWLGTVATCSLHYGISNEEPAHWVFVTDDASPELVFRVDARTSRPDSEWFRVQEAVVERVSRMGGNGWERGERGVLLLEKPKLAFYLERDLVVDGALEVLFAPAREAKSLRLPETRRARAAQLREGTQGGGMVLHPGHPASLLGRS